MRFGAADLFGLRGAVDPVARQVEADPGEPHGIVGAGGQNEFAAEGARFLGLGKDLGVEGVVGIGRDDGDAQFADGAFFNPARDAHGEVGDQAAVGVEHLEDSRGELHHHAGGLLRFWQAGDGGHNEGRAGGGLGPVDVRVEAADEVGAGVGAFGHEFEGGLVVERGLLGLADPGGFQWLQPREILGGEDELGERRGGEHELCAGGGVEGAGGGQITAFLIRAQGGGGLRPADAVDGAGGKAFAGEGDLRFEPRGDGNAGDGGPGGRGFGRRGLARSQAGRRVGLFGGRGRHRCRWWQRGHFEHDHGLGRRSGPTGDGEPAEESGDETAAKGGRHDGAARCGGRLCWELPGKR